MDVDIKNKSPQIESDADREEFGRLVEESTVEILKLYGCRYHDINCEIVAKDPLKSFHLYTNIPVRIEDCRVLIDLLI